MPKRSFFCANVFLIYICNFYIFLAIYYQIVVVRTQNVLFHFHCILVLWTYIATSKVFWIWIVFWAIQLYLIDLSLNIHILHLTFVYTMDLIYDSIASVLSIFHFHYLSIFCRNCHRWKMWTLFNVYYVMICDSSFLYL